MGELPLHKFVISKFINLVVELSTWFNELNSDSIQGHLAHKKPLTS